MIALVLDLYDAMLLAMEYAKQVSIDKLIEAQKYAMANRPPVGGFPFLAEVLRQAGVKANRWTLPSCQSVFQIGDDFVLQQGTPLVVGLYHVPKFDREALVSAIRADQAGRSTFPEFLRAAWEAGTIGYDVDFDHRKVRYYGANGESYVEDYPAVEVQPR